MNKLLYDKRVLFDDFQLYSEANNSSEYGYPHDQINIEEWEEVNVYICPHCIKKYGLYKETETTEEKINEVINEQAKGNYDYYDLTCGVDGCYNKDSFDGWLSIQKSEIFPVNEMFDIFLEESGFYDGDWLHGWGSLKKDILIWKKGTEHQEILDWFDNNFEHGLNDYIKSQWEFWQDEEDICIDCPKLIDCSKCTF